MRSPGRVSDARCCTLPINRSSVACTPDVPVVSTRSPSRMIHLPAVSPSYRAASSSPVSEPQTGSGIGCSASGLGHPAQSLTGDAFGTGLVVLAVLVCVGSPVVEELFFRGLLLRSLLGTFEQIGPRLGPALSIVVTALVFALVHFEALQFLGLAGFGVVLGVLAWRTGRLGPSIVAHMTFNTVTIIAIVVAR